MFRTDCGRSGGERRGAAGLNIDPKSKSGVKRRALARSGDRVMTMTLTDT